jgi:hypothetical protein
MPFIYPRIFTINETWNFDQILQKHEILKVV